MSTLLGDTNNRQDGDFSYIRTSNLYHYSVPQEFYGLRYKTLFKHLVLKRFMIPLGIYRTEKVSFAGLDPVSNEDDEDQSQNEEEKKKQEGDNESGQSQEGASAGDGNNKGEDFKSMVDKKKKDQKKKNEQDGDGNKSTESDKENDKYLKEIKYVITNPDKDLKLKENDTVFVLAQNDPKDPNVYWEDQPKRSTFFNFSAFDKNKPGV